MKTLFLKKWKLVIILIGLLLLFNSSWAQYPTLPYHPVGTESGYSVPANPFDFFDNITNVTFAGINNTTGAGPQWRMNYSGLTHATVERGQTYTLSVSVNASADFSYHDINVFFDWDNDGDCGGRLPTSGGTGAEANEKYDVAIGAGHANPATINITIPANATIGTIWMRVVLDADGSESDYLSYFSYGEIEEYAIDISSGITVPTVTTTAASNIATTSATLGGNVTADGGATVDARGIVYSLTSVNPNPQIGGTGVTQVSIGSGTGAFSQSVSSLSASSAYSFNSYAHNSQGYAYGTVSTFTTLGPEINIEGNSTSILDGDPSPSASDHTDFGSISTCVATEVRTFTIRNTGTADLTISSVDISGTNAADFSVTLSPAATITPSNTTTFQVTFNPSASGTRSATITVNNDDSDEAAYDFAIQGTGTDLSITALSQTNVSCSLGSNGAASVNAATGGTAPYSYNWTPGNPTGDGTTTVTGLPAGTWTCTVTDANGCTAFQDFTITQPSPLSLTAASQTNVSCNGGSNGAASVNTATGGAGGYTYNWTPGNPTGDGTTSVTGLTAGTWTCTVTDANSCTTSQNFTLTQPAALTLTAASQTNVSCNGGSNGAASVNAASGGAGGYTYNWTPGNPTGDGTTSITGLTAGSWTCTVTDANSCTASVNFTVIQPSALSLTPASQTNIACNGGATGAATVNAATGGAGGYTYDWTPGNPTGDGTVSVTGLTAGTWTCTVTDANGCTAIRNFTITQPTLLTLTQSSQTNIACYGDATGAASVNTANGGAGGYTYNWTPGNPTGDGTISISALTEGTWTCTVTDANNCTATADFTLTQPASALSISIDAQSNETAFGAADGAASVTAATGGTPTYNYDWTPGTPTGDGTNSVTGLTAGSYTCTVTDANSCTAQETFLILSPPQVVTTSATSIDITSATLGGEVTADGENVVTNRGIVYSTSDNTPEIGEPGITQDDNGSGIGSFSESISTLSAATTYYYQAYAINGEGTSYGGVEEFTTQNTILSIVRDGSTLTNTSSVSWTITFAASATGLTSSNFTLANTGLTSPSITNVSGSGTTWTVTANTSSGSGTLGLDFTSNTGLNAEMSNILPYIGEVYTIDKVAPLLSSSNPTDNSTTVFLGANVVLNFDENLVKGTGNITIRNSSDNSIFEQIDIADSRVTISGSQVTVNPSGVFLKGTGYYIEIDGTAIEDNAGNSYAGISGSTTLNFTTVDVVINEVVTDPQLDWSTFGFNGIVGAGAVTDYDEWVELYINTSGINFSGWTIELMDGSDIIGNLSALGAFVTSRYFGIGNFTSTISGDYLVLGRGNGSPMNNSITINLKDPTGAIVDAVTFNTNPSSNSDDQYNETAQRFPNGTDTNTAGDWTQGEATLGTANSGPSVKLSVSPASIGENAVASTVTATLCRASSQITTVTISNSGTATLATDYTLSSTSIVIPAGSTTGTATVTSIQDPTDEADETVTIDITTVTNGSEAGTQQQTITITDDNDPPLVTLSASPSTIAENDVPETSTITATLAVASAKTVTVTISASSSSAVEGFDYSLSSTTITILPGFLTGTATISSIQDADVEGHQTIDIDITGVSNCTEDGTQQVTLQLLDDDLPKVTLSQDVTSFGEEGGTNTITATLDNSYSEDAVITLGINASSTGTVTSDFTLSSTTITILAGNATGTATLTGISDNIVEADETIIVEILSCTNSIENGTQQVTSTITDDDVAELSIVATTQAAEDATDGLFTLSTTKQFDSPVTVTFSTSGTAASATDFTATGTTVVFPALSNTVTIPIEVLADNIVESDETVIVTMTNTSNSDVTIAASPNDHATVTITDDDVAELSIVSTTQATEDGTAGRFTISTTKMFDSPVTVTFAVTGNAIAGTDYSSLGTTVSFPAMVADAVIFVNAANDNIVESDETVIVTMTATSNTDVTIAATPNDHATVTITDDDVAELSIVATTQAAEDATNGVFTISTTKQFDAPVTVTFTRTGTATSASDFTAIGTTVVFPAYSNTVTIPVEVIADDIVESDETLIVTMTGTSNTDVTVAASPNNAATVTITDDDVAELSIVATTQAEEDATDGVFTISTTKQFDAPVTVTFAGTGDANAGTDFTAIGTTVEFPALSNSVTIPIEVIADDFVEGDETVIVTMNATNNSDVTIAASPDNTANITITDDDYATLRITRKANAYENVSDGSYYVITDKQFDSDVNVGVSAGGTATAGTDYTAIVSPQLFPANTDTLTITVAQLDDSESEINEYVILNLLNTNNARVSIAPAPDSTATVTIFDDDQPLVVLSQSVSSFSESGGKNAITATLNKVHHTNVYVTLAASGTSASGVDFVMPATITIPAGSLSASDTLRAVQDQLVEADETVVIDILSITNGVENGTQQVSSTIIDDDNALLHIAAATNVYENISDGSCFVITDKQFDADIEVSFSVSGTATAGTDYTALASPVIFPAYTDTLTIAVQQIDDSESEIIEYVIMNLLGTNNAKVGIMPAPDSTATITIIDDDMPLVELSQSALTFSEASGQNILTATLNKVHHDDVVVSIAANSGTATPGTDFSLPASITVEAGEITGSTTVTAIQDNLVESNETLTIEIASVLNGVENGTQEVSSTIIDDDIATLSIVATSHAAEDATNGLFTIFTNKQFDTPSTITFTLGGTATEGVDFLPVGTTVLFPAFTDYIEIPVEIVADDLIESKETVIIELTGTSAGNVLIGAQDKQTIAITDNDYGYLTASVNHHPTEGDGSQGIITIYSSKTVGSPVEVFFATDGTATQGADYAFSSPKVIIPEGADSVNVLADIFDDKLVEGNEYLTFVITGTSTKAIVADSTWANLLHMDIYDNDKAYIWLEPLADVNENGTPGLFAIRTDKPVQRDLEVEIFSYGSAIAGIDYVAPQRWFTYPAGDTSMTIPVIPIPDEIVESADSIVFSLLQVNCPNTVMKRDDHDAIALFIADDDSALISIAADSPVDENIQQAGFTLSTLKAFDVPVLVYYSLSGTATIGADFSVAPAPLLLPTLTNVARIPVSIIDDASIEGTETITVTIDSIMHAKAATDQGASSATLLVNDNDFVTLSVSSSERINERGFASFALTLGQAMETGITVTVSVGGTATEGTDFLALGRTFTIPAGQTELLLPVTIISDQVNEGDETIVVSIVSVSNAAVRPSLPASATLTITDDDPLPSISVLPASALENQGKISFLAKLSRTSGSLVSFVFSTSASGSADILSDFVYASDTLVFEPGETVKPIDITIIDDEAEEPDETFFLLLSDPQNALLLADSVAGTIINDDGRPVVTIRFTEQGIDENGGTAYLKASLDRVSGKEVSVFLAFDGEAENGTDVDVAANSFVLAPGMLADSILVTGLPDDIDETNEHLTVSVTATENAALAPGTILSLLVSDQDQTIHFEPVDQTVYGGPSFDLSASSSSGLIPVFSSDNQGVASIQGNTVTIKGAGTALITASQPGNGYFDPAGEVSQLLVVGKAELSVSVLPAQRQYGEEDPLFDLSFNGFVNGDSESSIDAEPIAVSSASAQSAPGVYTVTLSGGSDNNYSFAYLHGSLTVEKADQTIVFDLPASVNSTEPLALGATASSGLTVYYESSDLDVVRINGNTAIIVGPGTVTITARQDGDANYLPAESVSKTMVVNTVSASRIELDGPLCFPNPFVNVITLNQACSDATMVQVMDLAGRVVLERKNPGLNIDASALRNGSYLINITLKNGTALSQLIIKK